MDRKKNITTKPATAPSRRFTKELNVATSKKVPTIVRKALDPNEVVIHRRFGEGTKPLFPRAVEIKTEHGNTSTSTGKKQKDKTTAQKIKPGTSKTETAANKIPYFNDPKREADRLREKAKLSKQIHKRIDSSSSRSRSLSPRITRSRHSRRSYSHSPCRESRSRRRSRRRSRSRSYSRRGRSHNRYRSHSRDRHRRRSRSRRRSPEKQYIPIPVPVEYPMAGWFAPGIPPYARHPYMLRPPIPPPMPPMYGYRPQFPPGSFQGGYNNSRQQGRSGRPYFGSNYP